MVFLFNITFINSIKDDKLCDFISFRFTINPLQVRWKNRLITMT